MSTVDADLGAVVAQRIGEVAATLAPEALGEAMADLLIAEIPEFRDVTDEDFRAGVAMSCTGNLVAIREALVTGAPIAAITPPADATAWAHELVHRGMPLAALLRSYRLGHELFETTFERNAAAIELDPDVRWRVLAGATRLVFRYIDNVCTQLVDTYEGEREQWLRGAAAAQAELVQAIVVGEAIDPREAAVTLRYDVAGPQLALLVWRDTRTRAIEPARPLAVVAQELAAAFGGSRTLVVPMGEHAAWAWATGAYVAPPAARATTLADQVGVAVGGVHPGLEGMSRSHREARAARRVGDIFGLRPGSVLRYPAVALDSLVSADPAQAADFVTAELGEALMADTDTMLRLRATARVFLEERLSPSRTGRRLGIHQNTVLYRIKQVGEVLGRPVEERRLELEIALRLFDGLDGLRELR